MKRLIGSNQNMVIQNIEWMISTYNLDNARGEGPKKVTADLSEGFSIYKETVEPYLFSQDDWSAPVAKINQFFEDHKLYSENDLSEVQVALKN